MKLKPTAMARAMAAAGLLPTLGIYHRNRYNAFCLADDLMEPYRPFVDIKVRALASVSDIPADIGREQKAALLSIFNETIEVGDGTRHCCSRFMRRRLR